MKFCKDGSSDSDDSAAALAKRKAKMDQRAKKKKRKEEKALAKAKKREEKRERKKRAKEAKLAGKDKGDKGDKGYDSGDSYDSGAEVVATKDDLDFIDAEDDDEDLLKDYEGEQRFDDERGYGSDGEDDYDGRKKKKRKQSSSSRGGSLSAAEIEKAANPVSRALNRLKRVKPQTMTLVELEQEAEAFVKKMRDAADSDTKSIREGRTGLEKLKMLPEVLRCVKLCFLLFAFCF